MRFDFRAGPATTWSPRPSTVLPDSNRATAACARCAGRKRSRPGWRRPSSSAAHGGVARDSETLRAHLPWCGAHGPSTDEWGACAAARAATGHASPRWRRASGSAGRCCAKPAAALAGERTLLVGPPPAPQRAHSRGASISPFRRAPFRALAHPLHHAGVFGPLSIRAPGKTATSARSPALPSRCGEWLSSTRGFRPTAAILKRAADPAQRAQFGQRRGPHALPLISVVGATNQVPEDEGGSLLRPVSCSA